MAFGFPANFTESRKTTHRYYELTSTVKSTLARLGWQYRSLSSDEFEVHISINVTSWGEKMKIEILQDGVIKVESKCAYPFQCFDWGKNKKNVQIFFAALSGLELEKVYYR
jgi:hypothetical protein